MNLLDEYKKDGDKTMLHMLREIVAENDRSEMDKFLKACNINLNIAIDFTLNGNKIKTSP